MCRPPSALHNSELASSVWAAAAPQTAPVYAVLALSDEVPARPASFGAAAAFRSCFIWRRDLPTTQPCQPHPRTSVCI